MPIRETRLTSYEMDSFVTRGAACASSPETKAPKQLFVRMNGPAGLELPSLQVLRVFFRKFGRVVKITDAKDRKIAFVTFSTSEEAQAAKNAMNDHEVVDESNGVNLVRTLFVDFAMERGVKPVHVQAPRQAPVQAPRPEPAPIPPPSPATLAPVFDPSILSDCNDSFFIDGSSEFMKWLGPKTCLALFNIGKNPQPKVIYKKMQCLTLFSSGSPIMWYIPHPNHPSALTECLEGLDSGKFTHMTNVELPSEVLKMPNCWRC